MSLYNDLEQRTKGLREAFKIGYDEVRKPQEFQRSEAGQAAGDRALATKSEMEAKSGLKLQNPLFAAIQGYKDGAAAFQQKLEASGGSFSAMLDKDRAALVQRIKDAEDARTKAAADAASKAAEKAKVATGEPGQMKIDEDAGTPGAEKSGKDSSKKLAGAAARGSSEAWSAIMAAMGQAQQKDTEKRIAKAAEQTAKNTDKIAKALENPEPAMEIPA